MDNILKSVHKLSKIYNNVKYLDEYGTSLVIFIVLMIILFIIHSYFYVMTNIQPIKNNWVKERCSPKIIPFAGIINKPEGKSIIDFTEENFTYCVQNILTQISSTAVQPITFIVHTLQGIFNAISGDIQSIRSMFNNIRSNIQSVSEEIMGRLMNIMIPIQQIIIGMKDLFAKTQGIMTAGLYTMFGSYLTLQSLMGAIVQFIVVILLIILGTILTLTALLPIPIVGEIVAPLLAIDIGIFIAIAVPATIIAIFVNEVLGISTSPIPSLCFDKNTEFIMKNHSKKKIQDLEVGDILENNDTITAKIKVNTCNSKMFKLNDIIVSGNHNVFYDNKWIPVSSHPFGVKIENYLEPYLYCLNTSSKKIIINNTTFCDWDELYGDKLDDLIFKPNLIHNLMDGGFVSNTLISLKNGLKKKICDIKIGDILKDEVNVYGIVEINGSDLYNQYIYNLGNMRSFEGGVNLNIVDKNGGYLSTLDIDDICKIEREKENKLYHLLTDKKSFYVNNILFYDYNHCIELFI